MKVIVALDQSQYSEAALAEIKKRNWSKDTQFTLLSVIDLKLYDHEGWDATLLLNLDEFKKDLLAKRNQYLDSCVESLKRALPNIKNINRKVLQGRPRECIINEVREYEPDLLIMGSHGRKGISKLLLGSVAESVLVEAMCPVEIIKIKHAVKSEKMEESADDLVTFDSDEVPENKNAMKVMIAIQDMNCVKYITEFLSTYCPITADTSILLIHSCTPVTNYNFVDTDGANDEICNQIATERYRLGKKYLDEMYKKIDLTLSTPIDNVKQCIEEGDPRIVVEDKVKQWKPDMLILGSHVKTGLKSLGSVSRQLVTAVDCSVTVVPLLTKEEKLERLDQQKKIHIIV